MSLFNAGAAGVNYELLKRAVEAYKALSPLEKAIHDAEQKRSWVRGMYGLDQGPDLLVNEIYRLRALVASLGGDPLSGQTEDGASPKSPTNRREG